jgi:uncharacterized membrane protein YgcG
MRDTPFTTHLSASRLRILALAGALLLALALGLAATTLGAPTTQARSLALAVTTPPACDTYQPSQHIYDCAALLKPAEISALEVKADAVRQAGAPVVVYLQVKSATYEQTLTDAANLMAGWNVESQSGAKDGLVILLYLKPGDLRHGQVAIYAGKTLINGPLPQSELTRIYQDVMLPDLRDGQTASGIGAGLDALAADLRAGGPPAPAGQGVARAIGTIPYNIVAALLALLAIALGLTQWRRARAAAQQAPATVPTTTPPATLTPAVGGALITGRVGAAQMEATILDFARRGLLTMEPLNDKQAQIHLLRDGRDLTGYEQLLWQALYEQTTDDVIPPERLQRVARGWGQATETIKRDLIERGWFDAEQSRKRLPYILIAVASLVLVPVGIVLGVLAAQPWPFIGAMLCLIGGVIALIFAVTMSSVTSAGYLAGQEARDYLAGLAALPSDATVSEALPWLVATGKTAAYSQRLRWEATQPHNQFAMIYPYWLLIHTSMAPPAATGSVAGATGAAAGGGGAGGAF